MYITQLCYGAASSDTTLTLGRALQRRRHVGACCPVGLQLRRRVRPQVQPVDLPDLMQPDLHLSDRVIACAQSHVIYLIYV